MSGHISPKSVYWTIFIALMVLTGVTVAVAFQPLGVLNFPVAITIAISKATLVVLFFMHVKYSSKLTKMIVGMALFFLMTMFGLTLTDYLSRGWFAAPHGTALAGQQKGVTPDGKRLEPTGFSDAPKPAAPKEESHSPEH
jgi:cytochrome c oxidase subunit 4